MGLFRRECDKTSACGVDALIERLGPLDKRDVQARMALIGMGADAVPALLSVALHELPAEGVEVPPRVAAAHTVLVMIGEPAMKAAQRVISSSDDKLVVAGAAELVYRTALQLGAAVPDAVKAETERKTGVSWAAITGEGAEGGGYLAQSSNAPSLKPE